jgi:hypothetical protein
MRVKWKGSKVRFEVLKVFSVIALMMAASSTSETSVNFYQTTRCNTPEDSRLHALLLVVLKSKSLNENFLFSLHWPIYHLYISDSEWDQTCNILSSHLRSGPHSLTCQYNDKQSPKNANSWLSAHREHQTGLRQWAMTYTAGGTFYMAYSENKSYSILATIQLIKSWGWTRGKWEMVIKCWSE